MEIDRLTKREKQPSLSEKKKQARLESASVSVLKHRGSDKKGKSSLPHPVQERTRR